VTSFDFLVIFVLALSIGFAVIRGALKEIGTLLVLAAAAVGGFILIKPFAAVFFGGKSSFLLTSSIGLGVGAALFIALYAGLHVLLRRFPMTARAQQVDRIFGGVFGLARGLVLIGLGFLAYAYYLDDERRPDAVAKAVTLPLAKGMAQIFEGMAPESTRLDHRPDAKPDVEVEKKEANAARDGYARSDRSALSEMVATVTTSDNATQETDAAANALREGKPQ
jgi:membrane protein required for colicin V production